MGFALWVDEDVAWAEGTHEYRPMGAAVISVEGVFCARDFKARLKAPARRDPRLAGLFASLGEMNDWLEKGRKARKRGGAEGRSQELKIDFRGKVSRSFPEF